MGPRPAEALHMEDHDEEDSDLADLLGSRSSSRQYDDDVENDKLQKKQKSRNKHRNARGGNSATAALNLDHLTQAKIKLSPRHFNLKRMPYSNYHNSANLLSYTASYLSMLCYFYPRVCTLLLVMALGLAAMGVFQALLNPKQHYGHINHDLVLHVHSKYDFSLGDIDHWCLQGDSNSAEEQCPCEDPLVPQSRMEHKSWIQAHRHNRKMLQRYEKTTPSAAASSTRPAQAPLDVVFVGESVVEEMDGRWMGLVRSDRLEDMYRVFRKNFSRRAGANMEGVALGIAGDAAPNVLWRLMHGELPDHVDPKVFWISVGNNDLDRMQCSEEVVVIAVLRVVEELLERRPNAHVVINSLFPMITSRGGQYPLITDYTDALTEDQKHDMTTYSLEDALIKDAAVEQGEETRRLGWWRSSAKEPTTTTTTGEEVPVGEDTETNAGTPTFQIISMEDEASEHEEAIRLNEYTSQHHSFFSRSSPPAQNPIMLDQESMHKYKATAVFTQHNDIPFWTSIRAINRELDSFAQTQERVSFFDATPVFVHEEGDGMYRSRMRSDRLSSTGHPTTDGIKAWQAAIVTYLEPLLQSMGESTDSSTKSKATPATKTSSSNENTETGKYSDDGTYDDMIDPSEVDDWQDDYADDAAFVDDGDADDFHDDWSDF